MAESEEHGRFGWEDWTWDETVFRGTAPYYRKDAEMLGETGRAATEVDVLHPRFTS